MWILEIAMLLVGCFAVVYSIRLSEKNKGEEKTTERVEYVEYAKFPDTEWKAKVKKLKAEIEDVYQEVDDKISKLSNEKIMGMNEYSDQVLDKIEKNHGEVVFLYDMMNEKQEEIKKTVNEVDVMRAGLKDDTEKEFQRLLEKEEVLDQMKQDIEMESLNIQAAQKEIKKSQQEIMESQRAMEERQRRMEESQKNIEERQRMMQKTSDMDFAISEMSEELISGAKEMLDAAREQEVPREEEPERIPEESVPEPVQERIESVEQPVETKRVEVVPEPVTSVADVIDAEIARIEKEEEQETRGQEQASYQPLTEQKKPENHNDEIIELHKKGRSVLEISRMLSLGQGEVKFVLDLYKARG